jgi:hypothetical protein
VYFLLHIVTKYGTILYTPPESRQNLDVFINVFNGVCGHGHAPTAGASKSPSPKIVEVFPLYPQKEVRFEP